MALLKTSKVKSVQANGTWDSKFGGTFYKFEVEMENGNAGEYSSKTKDQDKFVVGEEVQYEFEDGRFPKIKPYYNKGNLISASKGGYTDADKMRMAKSVAIKSASIFFQNKEVEKEKVKSFADFCYNYIVGEDKSGLNENTDDLPF